MTVVGQFINCVFSSQKSFYSHNIDQQNKNALLYAKWGISSQNGSEFLNNLWTEKSAASHDRWCVDPMTTNDNDYEEETRNY